MMIAIFGWQLPNICENEVIVQKPPTIIEMRSPDWKKLDLMSSSQMLPLGLPMVLIYWSGRSKMFQKPQSSC
jgi:hypothetical protein